MATHTIIINRADNYVQSYDIWARSATYPRIDGDGIFVGNAVIGTNDTSVSYDWTAPGNGTWKFVIIARRFDSYSRPTRIT